MLRGSCAIQRMSAQLLRSTKYRQSPTHKPFLLNRHIVKGYPQMCCSTILWGSYAFQRMSAQLLCSTKYRLSLAHKPILLNPQIRAQFPPSIGVVSSVGIEHSKWRVPSITPSLYLTLSNDIIFPQLLSFSVKATHAGLLVLFKLSIHTNFIFVRA